MDEFDNKHLLKIYNIRLTLEAIGFLSLIVLYFICDFTWTLSSY